MTSKPVLPPLKPVPGLEHLKSPEDLLTAEDKADYAEFVKRLHDSRRRALEWAATHQMP